MAKMCAKWAADPEAPVHEAADFLNPVLDGEIKKALETLALSNDTQKKVVSLHFNHTPRS